MRIYLAGPITGRPGYRAEFAAASALIATTGHTPVSPLSVGEHPDWGWADYMRSTLALLLRCDGVAMLPEWRESRGARIEARLARGLGLPVLELEAWAELATSRGYADGLIECVSRVRRAAAEVESLGVHTTAAAAYLEGWRDAAELLDGLL